VLTGWEISKKLIAAVLSCSLGSGLIALAGITATRPHQHAAAVGHASRQVHHALDHSCCPRAHVVVVPVVVAEFPLEGIPCRERPCCVSHGPDAPSSFPITSGTSGRTAAQQAFGEKTGMRVHLRFASQSFRNILLSQVSLNTVLRI
jgi:hypothetical protein